jgi:leucine dehydrogenase
MVGDLSETRPEIWRGQCREGSVFFAVLNGDGLLLPANGGLRVLSYSTETEALAEAQVLSQRMGWQHRLYGTGFSGVKIVAKCDPQNPDRKKSLLCAIAAFLNELEGRVYTGCDLNTDSGDMAYLAGMTPYVLSSLGSRLDGSRATGYGVLGGVLGCVGRAARPMTCLVQGDCQVGVTVSELLLREGHEVLTCLPTSPDWWRARCDVLVLCSGAHVITEEIARELKCRVIVGGTHTPFATERAGELLRSRGIIWIPDVITGAGAVICDSIEHYAPVLFRETAPERIYTYVHRLIARKTEAFLKLQSETGLSPGSVLGRFLDRTSPFICGTAFRGWLESTS